MAKISSIRKSLTDDQKKIYDESMKELKQKFLSERPGLSPEHIALVDEQLN